MKKILMMLGLFIVAFAFAPSAKAFDLYMGNTPVTDRTNVDSYHNFSIVDTNNSADFEGIITEIQYFARNTNPFKFLIVDGAGKVEWKSDLITPATGVQTYTLATAAVVHPGWNIGMYFQSTGTIPWDLTSAADPAYYENNNAGEPAIGETLTIAGTTPRYYSLYASGWKFVGDSDGDGINDTNDVCPTNTTADGAWSDLKGWGTNRWQYYDGSQGMGWYQNKPKGVSDKIYDLSYTFGCNGHQILEKLTAGLGENAMNGHWKFGLSSSVLEDFHNNWSDGNISGKYFIETVTVPAVMSTDTLSAYPLVSGVNYVLNARGTANAGDGITFDARYSIRTPSSPTTWTDVVSTYDSYGPKLLDLFYNGSTPWGDYNSSHEYEANVTGTGVVVPFRIYDVYYSNNSSNLYVDIYAQL